MGKAGGARTGPASQSRRPPSYQALAVVLLLVSLVIVVVNDAVVVGAAAGWLTPGGMFELYASVGMMCAAGATWWFGWFDRR